MIVNHWLCFFTRIGHFHADVAMCAGELVQMPWERAAVNFYVLMPLIPAFVCEQLMSVPTTPQLPSGDNKTKFRRPVAEATKKTASHLHVLLGCAPINEKCSPPTCLCAGTPCSSVPAVPGRGVWQRKQAVFDAKTLAWHCGQLQSPDGAASS